MNDEKEFREWFRNCISEKVVSRFDFSDNTFTIYINSIITNEPLQDIELRYRLHKNVVIRCICNNQLDFGC